MIYEINLSKGSPIKIDQDDLDKIKANVTERLVILKQAIVNPAFIVTITPVEEETKVITKAVLENGVPKLVTETVEHGLEDIMGVTKRLS